jgi:hypothetical protein
MKLKAEETLTSSALKILHSRLTLIFPHYTAGPGGGVAPTQKKEMDLGSDGQGATSDRDCGRVTRK